MNVGMIVKSLDDLKSLPLGEATAQEIQLEIIRRWEFNAFDGSRVAGTLREHRDLWEAVVMDRLAISNWGKLPAMGLIKLRVHDDPRDVDCALGGAVARSECRVDLVGLTCCEVRTYDDGRRSDSNTR